MPPLIRVVIAVLLGYLAMVSLVLLTLLPAVTLVDLDRVRDPGTGVMSNWFIFVIEWPVSLFSAVAGGLITAVVAGRRGRGPAIRGLGGFVVVVGLLAAVLELSGFAIGDRDLRLDGELAGTSVEETEAVALEDRVARDGDAIQVPVQPIWDAFLLPFVGALGVVLGGRTVDRADGGLLAPPESPDG